MSLARLAAPTALPSRAAPRGMEPLRTLYDDPLPDRRATRGGLRGELARRYDGDLRIPLRPGRPTLIANFVETLDGVVAMDRHGRTGGGEVSGFSPTDRFVMGLLRSLADVVVIGAATLRSSPRAAWTPDAVFPDAAAAFAELRSQLGLAIAPTTLVVTRSGDIDPDHPLLRRPGTGVVLAGPQPAADHLARQRFGPQVRIEPLDDDGDVPAGIVELSRHLGAGIVLSEAGPHLFSALVRSGVVDELFLTVSPQLAGRAPGHDRLSIVEDAALWPGTPRWTRLLSVRHAGDHLFLRYQLEEIGS